MAVTKKNYLEEPIEWNEGGDAEYPYETVYKGRRLRLRVNDFPDDHMYTLIVDEDDTISFDDWPDRWMRDGVFNTLFDAVSSATNWKRRKA